MMKIPALLLSGVALGAATAAADGVPAADRAMAYYDRHLIDVTNLRHLTEGSMIGDMMVHADAMFTAEDKWKMTLYQMVQAESAHHQARSAIQLSHLGVPVEHILALWQPGYIDTIEDPRLKAAFTFVDQLSTLPGQVTAASHAMLRTHFVDRQIAELIEMVSFNAANALHDGILPIPTDQATLDWANATLARAGWSAGKNSRSSPEEQRAALFAGEIMEAARQEILSGWMRADLSAPAAQFETDWLNAVTGYDISRITMDSDQDGVEDPFDAYPVDHDRWAAPGLAEENLPDRSVPPFDVAAYDWAYYIPPATAIAPVPFSDRINFDTEWTRQTAMGTSRIEDYFAAGDRALPMKFLWQVFVTYQLASGCVHCQVHGSFGIFQEFEADYVDGEVPPEDLPEVLAHIRSLMDIERSTHISEAERAALSIRPLMVAPDKAYTPEGYRRFWVLGRPAGAFADYIRTEYLVPEGRIGVDGRRSHRFDEVEWVTPAHRTSTSS
ncbi:MAG: hypothetical protein AAF281_14670 [Pseudomonadota bacterium]